MPQIGYKSFVRRDSYSAAEHQCSAIKQTHNACSIKSRSIKAIYATWFCDADQSESRMGNHCHVTMHQSSHSSRTSCVQFHTQALCSSIHSIETLLLISRPRFNNASVYIVVFRKKYIFILFEKKKNEIEVGFGQRQITPMIFLGCSQK